ncbi:MAG: hypothetical protein V4481_04395, partial [Patescibacteria group bacterium]
IYNPFDLPRPVDSHFNPFGIPHPAPILPQFDIPDLELTCSPFNVSLDTLRPQPPTPRTPLDFPSESEASTARISHAAQPPTGSPTDDFLVRGITRRDTEGQRPSNHRLWYFDREPNSDSSSPSSSSDSSPVNSPPPTKKTFDMFSTGAMALPQTAIQVVAPAVLQPFDPDTSEINEYVRRFETVALSQGWNESHMIAMLPLLLSAVPAEWYREFLDSRKGRPPSHWSTLRDALTKAFTRRGGTDRADAQLRKRRMQPGESVDTYLFDVIRLCKLVDLNMPDHRKIHFITRGLPPVMFSQVMSRDFDTVNDLRHHLHKLEDSRHIFGDDSPYFEMMNQASSKNTELKSEMQEMKTLVKDLVQLNSIQLNAMGDVSARGANPTPSTSQQYRQPPSQPRVNANQSVPSTSSASRPPPYRGAVTNDGQPICFRCNQAGHVSASCQNEPVCRYCKLNGHLIAACPTRPPRPAAPGPQTVPGNH